MVCWTRPSSSEGGRPKRGRGAVAPEQRGGATGAAAEGVPPAGGGGGGGGGSSSAGGVCPPADDGTPIKNGKLCCDACDGEHKTTECPVFKGKARDKHKDAQKGKGPSIGKPGGNFVLRTARVVRQPGDGSCLFHSMSYGLGGTSASSLRRGIADWIASHPRYEIAETPVSDWVRWDSNCSVTTYARRMRVGGWGGGIEMAACSVVHNVNVHVYEKKRGSYKRISCFDAEGARKTLHVLYGGRMHYDALIP